MRFASSGLGNVGRFVVPIRRQLRVNSSCELVVESIFPHRNQRCSFRTAAWTANYLCKAEGRRGETDWGPRRGEGRNSDSYGEVFRLEDHKGVTLSCRGPLPRGVPGVWPAMYDVWIEKDKFVLNKLYEKQRRQKKKAWGNNSEVELMGKATPPARPT